MYRIPEELDLSEIIEKFTTQIRVGQYDIQFSFGEVDFAIQSPVNIVRNGVVIGTWQSGMWPPEIFYEIMNIEVDRYEIPNNITIVIHLRNGIEIHLVDDSDMFECMQISTPGVQDPWII